MSTYNKGAYQAVNLLKWIGRVCLDMLQSHGTPVDVIFCMVDHFEPSGRREFIESRRQIERLIAEYPKLANKHRDYENVIPKRTWFFPPHHHKYWSIIYATTSGPTNGMPVEYYGSTAAPFATRTTAGSGWNYVLASGRSRRAGSATGIARSWCCCDAKAGKWASTWCIGCTKKKAWL